METFSKVRAMHIKKTLAKAMHITKTKTTSPKPKHSSSKPVAGTFSPAMAMDTSTNSTATDVNNNNNSCSTTAFNSDLSSNDLNSNSTKPPKHAKSRLSSSLKKLTDDIKAKRNSIAARHQKFADRVSSSPPIAALRFLSITARRSASKYPKQRSSCHDTSSQATPLSDYLTRPSPTPTSISTADPVDPLRTLASSAPDSSDLTSIVASSPATRRHLPAQATKARHYALIFTVTAAIVIAISACETFALALKGASDLFGWFKGKLTFDAASQGSDGRATTFPRKSADVFRRSVTVPHRRESHLSPSNV